MLKDKKMGWAHVDVVLLTGGSSRMPMIRNKMKQLSGRTMNTSLSPDQSIAHGATYFAGMLLTNNKFAKSILSDQAASRLAAVKQKNVNARSLGILVRNPETDRRMAHYLIPENTSLPVAATKTYGTVIKNQKRVHLQIVESGLSGEGEFVKLGDCIIEDLPADSPEGSEVAVKIIYDEQAKVHVTATDVTSGKKATAILLRSDSIKPQLASDQHRDSEVQVKKMTKKKPKKTLAPADNKKLESANQPIPLCNDCGAPLTNKQECPACGPKKKRTKKRPASKKKTSGKKTIEGKDAVGEDEFWSMVDVD